MSFIFDFRLYLHSEILVLCSAIVLRRTNLYQIKVITTKKSGKSLVAHHKKGLLNLIKNQWPDIDEIYLYLKDPFQ